MEHFRLRMKPYLQPFEQHLAVRELQALMGRSAEVHQERTGTWAMIPSRLARKVREHATYWDLWDVPEEGWTRQAGTEASALIVRNGIPFGELRRLLPTKNDAFLPNRRTLRYGPHGLHEYRGKFFPQLVGSLMNIAELPRRGTLLDPMCGSGTTLVEGCLRGASVVGFDLNPLSVMISQAKVEALSIRARTLISWYERVRDGVLSSKPRVAFARNGWFRSLPLASQDYLLRWIPAANLLILDEITALIQRVRPVAVRRLMLVCLSNVIRRISYQVVDDLRVRRRSDIEDDLDPYKLFLDELGSSVRAIVSLEWQRGTHPGGRWQVEVRDARSLGNERLAKASKFDLCITSPPYATALPYLDTDRLSLTYFNLAPRTRQRELEGEMIGNRELSASRKEAYTSHVEANWKHIPAEARKIIGEVDERNRDTQAGFRRRNLPVLLAKYFVDMHQVLDGLHNVLKPGASCFLVVGRNHTIAGGQRVDIPTDLLLQHMADAIGFETVDLWPMEMLRSRDIFKANASSNETILWLRT